MSEPELWTRCPKEWPHHTHGCSPRGADDLPDGYLVRVPFDEAVERMAAVDDIDSDYGFITRNQAEVLLRAALGEGR